MTNETTLQAERPQNDGRFGWCPQCRNNDGYLNVGSSHWFFCTAHKAKWCAGSNLFSSWRDETEDEQRKQYDKAGLGTFLEVAPAFPVYEAGQSVEPPAGINEPAIAKVLAEIKSNLRARDVDVLIKTLSSYWDNDIETPF